MSVRTRFAPSPTGFLHAGTIRTALFAWLFAKQQGGEFLLRIEDTDKEREVAGATEHIMESLSWLGLFWDEGPKVDGPYAPYIQSERLELYQRYATELLDKGLAYPDPYTPEEVEAFRNKAEEEKRPFLFREHRPEQHAATWDGTTPLRFRVPEIRRTDWHDEVRGELTAGPEALDDFILLKSDGYPTYNFCHVVDDIEMKITHVMRGQEFISSTPKFISLYEAFGATPPSFVTMPPILAEGGGKKLSKRDGAKDMLQFRDEGFLPEAVVNFLALLGWNPGTPEEFFSRDELVQAFSLERIQKSGAQLSEEKLLDINQHWMRRLTDEEFIDRGDLTAPDAAKLLKAVPILKERAHTFGEAKELLTTELLCLFEAPGVQKDLLVSKEPESEPGVTRSHLEAFRGLLETYSGEVTQDNIKEALMPYADAIPKDQGGRGAALWPLRYALSGLERSPDPFTLISILGAEESINRIEVALAAL